MRTIVAAASAVLLVVAVTVALRGAPATEPSYEYNILGIAHTAPGELPVITFSVSNPSTGATYDLRADPAWQQTANGASRLFFQIAWNTIDITNTNSDSNKIAGGRGAAMPIPVNALGSSLVDNGNGTYTIQSSLPVPLTANGSGEVAMEGHPAAQDPATGLWTVRVPVKSVHKYFAITDAAVAPRRQVVDSAKCMVCHASDGTGVAPRLTVHGNNRTEEPQVCVTCHNPNNTDIPYRLATDPAVKVGSYTYPEQSLDFKRFVHGIHASSAGFRANPLVVIGFNHSVFDASTLTPFPGELQDCTSCHIDDGTKGTFELPLASGVLGSTFNTRSIKSDGTVAIDTDPSNDVKVSPIAAVCSSCHDGSQVISHMAQTGNATFDGGRNGRMAQERCPRCHGPGKDKSVRKVHLWDR